MGKIVFVTSSFLPNPDANGVCVAQVIKQMQTEGKQIVCICNKENDEAQREIYDGIEIIRVDKTYFSKKLEQSKRRNNQGFYMKGLLATRRLRSALLLPFFPNVEPFRAIKIKRIIENLVKTDSIDCIIGVFRPFDGVWAALKIKRKFPHIICGGYYLDIITGAVISKFIPKRLYEKLCNYKEKKVFQRLDFVMMAEAGKEIYNKEYFKDIQEKIKYVNFPVFCKLEYDETGYLEFRKDYFNIVYAGSLDVQYRNPSYIFEALKVLCKQGFKIKVHIYGKNNCMHIINKYCKDNPDNFSYYGSVSNNYARQAIAAADCVLNISNSTSNIVPSKVFELCASCKPIINVVTNPNDVSLKYFDIYPNKCYIYEYADTVSESAAKLIKFISTCRDTKIDYHEIEPLFYTSTPIATTDIINKFLEKSGMTE